MKKKQIALVSAAFLLGAFAGFAITAQQYTKIVKWMTDTSVVSGITSAYAPLKLIHDGHTDRAISLLETSLESAIHAAEMNNELLKTSSNHIEEITRARELLQQRREKQESTEPAGGAYGAPAAGAPSAHP
jgi:hypothetical protein